MALHRPEDGHTMRTRVRFALAAAGIVLLGLLSRMPALHLPPAWGDVLWACMLYALLGLIAPQSRMARSAMLAWGLCILVECSQLLHTPWLDALRATALGHLLLGSTFVAGDLLCYTLGVACMYAVERWIRRRERR